MAACESGFAIDYCIDGNYECSSTTTSSITLSKCVDVIEIDSLNGCKIKIGGLRYCTSTFFTQYVIWFIHL